MNESLKHCDLCNLDKPLSKMYKRIRNGIKCYSIGCKDCYNIKMQTKRDSIV